MQALFTGKHRREPTGMSEPCSKHHSELKPSICGIYYLGYIIHEKIIYYFLINHNCGKVTGKMYVA